MVMVRWLVEDIQKPMADGGYKETSDDTMVVVVIGFSENNLFYFILEETKGE